MPADSGRIVLDGSDLTQLDDRDRARLRAERIGVVLQRGNLIPFLTARENVEMAMALAGRGTARDQARALLAEVGLEQRLDHLPQRMSGGESQRVAVAVALANEPDLLLADEVTGELDSASELAVMDSLFHACERRALSVLYVTHDPEIAARAQRRLRLERKRVVPA